MLSRLGSVDTARSSG